MSDGELVGDSESDLDSVGTSDSVDVEDKDIDSDTE